ncbi:MAG TPA: acyltransferase [Actinomycetota bacterium]|nr:acyltransferase [Actinomycetota bacterium]
MVGERVRLRLDDVVAATPVSRDRVMDFFRAASIIVVVFGHWFIGVIWWRGGKIGTVSAIGLTGWLWIATWFLQVIPLFFFVGGFANYVGYQSSRRQGRSIGFFLWSRSVRLLKPSLVFVGVWVLIEVILHLMDVGGTGLLRGVRPPGATVPFGPLWFLAVYFAVVVASPLTVWLHRRFDVAVPIALLIGAIVVDVLRFGANVEWIGQANVWLVFLLPHQLGYFYAEGRLGRLPRTVFVAMAAVGIATMMALTNLYRFFPGISVYPRSLLGTDVGTITNTNPPTLMMLAMAVWSIGGAMLARPVLAKWLERARVWKAVVFTNTIVMTLFLWHMTAYLIAVLLLWPLGLGQQGDTTASWWIERPLWELVPAVFLVGLVMLFVRFERPRPVRPIKPTEEKARADIG